MGRIEDRRTGNMCWAWFGHGTSRPMPGMPPDMQEHAHVFVFNVTDDPVEERIKAGEFGGIKRDGEYYSAVFYSLLAKNLVELGFGIDRRGGKEWELAGVLQSMIDTFSKRRDQVLDKAEELGITAEIADCGADRHDAGQQGKGADAAGSAAGMGWSAYRCRTPGVGGGVSPGTGLRARR